LAICEPGINAKVAVYARFQAVPDVEAIFVPGVVQPRRNPAGVSEGFLGDALFVSKNALRQVRTVIVVLTEERA
jgi:hypothetical protein